MEIRKLSTKGWNLDVKIKKDFLNYCSVQGTKNIGVEVKGRDNLALDT